MKKEKLIKNIVIVVLLVAVFFILNYLMSERIIKGYDQRIIITVGINIILAVSLNIILGFTGQLALGHAGFMSIGAYAAAMLTLKMHTPFIVSLLFGASFAALIALIIGYPILRLKGDYLAICTLGFGEIVKVLIQNIDAVGGARGLVGIPMKTNFAWVYFAVIIAILITWNLAKSNHGRAMLSVREDEIAAESMGVNVAKAKIMAFTIGGFLAGIAGGLYAHYFMFLDPKSFDFLKSTDILTYVVFGGMGSITGSVVAAGVLTWLPELLRDFSNIQDYRIIIFALLLIVLMIFRPQGLMGVKEFSLDSLRFWKWKIFNRKGGGSDVAS